MKHKFFKIAPLAATMAFYLACMLLAMGLNLDERVTALLPDSDPEIADFKTFITQVPAAEALYIQINTDNPDPDLLARAGDAFYDAIKNTLFFTDILYQFSQDDVLRLVNLMGEKKYRLLEKEDLFLAESNMNKRGLEKRLQEIKRQLVSSSGVFTAHTLARDPFALNNMILKKLVAFQSDMPGAMVGESRIISKTGTSLLMVATPTFPAVDTEKSKEMFNRLSHERQRITADFDQTIHIGFSGAHLATLDNSATIQSDVKRTILVLGAAILFMGILFFRRFYHVLLIFVPSMVSLAFAGAVAALISHEISAIALGCGALLVGITVDFGIHILFHTDTLGTAHAGKIIKKLRRPLITGAATTITAFGCLVFSSLPGQRQMGWISILGIFGAATFALTILKYFITVQPWSPAPPRVSLVNISNTLMALRKRHAILLFSLCIALTLAGLAGLGRFTFDGDVAALNHLSPRTQADMDNFLDTWGQASPTIFMVQATDLEQALEKNDALFKILKEMEKKNQINSPASLSTILPSFMEQEKRLDRMKEVFSQQRISTLKTDLDQACLESGFSQTAFTPFFEELTKISKGIFPAPVMLEDFKATVVSPLIKSRLIEKPGQILVLTTAVISDKTLLPMISARVKTALPGTLVIDKPYLVKKITTMVADEFKQFLVWAALSMVLVLSLCQRRPKVILTTIIPVVLSTFITAGLMGLAGIPVNLISIVFVIFVFGVGVDFSIFLVHHGMSSGRDGRQITPGAVIICGMTTIGAFACLCFARHKALVSIGAAGLTGMTVSLFTALVIIPFLTEHWIMKTSQKEPRLKDPGPESGE
ncbi:MAG: MMPL family transporter [Desulfotignum sp.]|nr:MMPL family transporter [Desulfotignum sp.]